MLVVCSGWLNDAAEFRGWGGNDAADLRRYYRNSEEGQLKWGNNTSVIEL